MSTELLRKAVLNNADWCGTVCRTHNIDSVWTEETWTSAVRTPLYYPDAVTLSLQVDVESMLAKIDTSSGCSIKDSFASLDLSACGFEVLFDAQWIAAAGEDQHESKLIDERWQRVATPSALSEWQRAWDTGYSSPLFLPQLLTDASVTVLSKRRDDQIVGGAVLNGSRGVVGVSNVFTSESNAKTWSELLAFVKSGSGQTIVGYESGEDLVAAVTAGFSAIGPLRVWIRT